MRQNTLRLCLAVGIVFCIGLPAVNAASRSRSQIKGESLSLLLPSGETLVLYPPDNQTSIDTCPDAAWKQFKLHKTPPDYDPLNWTSTEWQDYLRDYVVPTASLSFAFFLIGLVMLVVMTLWRLVQWCAGCGGCRRTCSVGAETPDWLGDRKHTWVKGWIYLLSAGVIAMVVWGMLALDAQLINAFWRAVRRILEAGNNLSSQMEEVQYALNTSVPAAVNNISYALSHTINSANLTALVASSLTFAKISQPSSSAVGANSTTLAARVAEVVNATTVLAAQLAANSTSASGRHLLATSASASDYASLGALLAALTSGLPRLAAANSTTADMAARLRTLQDAAANVSAQLSAGASPSPDSLTALQSALTGGGGGGVGAPVGGGWSDQLAALLEGARAYEAARGSSGGGGGGGAVFNATEALAQDLVKGAQGLLSGAALVQSLTSRLGEFRARVCDSPLSDIRALFHNFQTLVNNTVDASTWTIRYKGKSTPFLQLVDSLEGDVEDFFRRAACGNTTTAGSSGSSSSGSSSGRRRRALMANGDWSLDGFIASIANGSATAASLNATAGTLAAAANAAEQAANAAPSSASASATVSGSLSPTLAAAAGPLANLSSTLAAYVAGTATPAQLRAALDAAAAPLSNATSAFSGAGAGVDASGALKDAANSLLAASASLSAAAATLSSELSADGAGLARLQAQAGAVGAAAAAYADLVDGLPAAAATTAQLAQVQDDVLSTVSEVSTSVNTTSVSASVTVGSATTTLNSQVLAKGYDFEDNWQSDTQDISNIVYGVWMGVYGLAALCLLVMMVAVWRNWPAGLLVSGLMLLCLILVSQVLCAAFAIGLALLDDACANLEDVALRQAVRSDKVPVAVVMSYYFYNTPSMADLNTADKTAPIKTLIDAAFNVDFNTVITQASTVNTTLLQELEDAYSLRGATLTAVDAAVDLVFDPNDGLLANITDLLSLVHYDNINPLYTSAKDLFCCATGTFAFNQWCAMTAAAAITFGALIAASYLLARMDMIGARAGCCSCCTCACYRPADRNKQREEEAVDLAVAAALAKKGNQYAMPPPQHGLMAAAAPAAAGAAAAPAAPSGAPDALPTGFMTAAGGAAAFAALAAEPAQPQGVVAGYPYQPAPYSAPYTLPPMGK
ncbi:hypothetical protein HXX76_015680 [Chlamydomonas incerta]|uniref:Uncharacterized protein n=1 Tax=Chlamydomonas incerta TaxID=51695 RepID=A0A835SIA2_CHLIN|nr:hypothetical protein HXX76_015680 [Chlamydomonas incerta]|eukprot:KAG2422929.1 hypothetical protein HXX76_015680 [Chlamydomonas incerta]